MDYTPQPQDATCVIKIMKELDNFMGQPQTRRSRLFGQDSSLSSSRGLKRASVSETTLSNDEKADLIASKVVLD